MKCVRINLFVLVVALISTTAHAIDQQSLKAFFKQNCLDCHSTDNAEGGLDLSQNKFNLTDPANLSRWVRIHDRIAEGEMPPPDYGTINVSQKDLFLNQVGTWIQNTQQQQFEKLGRVRARRLTNLQFERTLHDLLGIDIPLAIHFPAETKINGYTTVADGQPMSQYQMEQHLTNVDRALEEAFRRALQKQTPLINQHLTAEQLSRQNPKKAMPRARGD